MHSHSPSCACHVAALLGLEPLAHFLWHAVEDARHVCRLLEIPVEAVQGLAAEHLDVRRHEIETLLQQPLGQRLALSRHVRPVRCFDQRLVLGLVPRFYLVVEARELSLRVRVAGHAIPYPAMISLSPFPT